MEKDILLKVQGLFEKNYKNICLSALGTNYCYALLSIGLRVHCHETKSVVTFNNKNVAVFTGNDHEIIFKTMIHFNDLSEQEKLVDAKNALLELEDNPKCSNNSFTHFNDKMNEFKGS